MITGEDFGENIHTEAKQLIESNLISKQKQSISEILKSPI